MPDKPQDGEEGEVGARGMCQDNEHGDSVPLTAPHLAIGCYKIVFRAPQGAHFPEYAGSAWRGALGHALKRALCITHAPVCKTCLLYHACGYAYVFETPPPLHTSKMRRYDAVPHPFLLNVVEDQHIAPDDTYPLGLMLVGRANAHLGYLIHALAEAGRRGVGTGRQSLILEQVAQKTDAGRDTIIYTAGGTLGAHAPQEWPCPPVPSQVRMLFETPLRLRRQETYLGPTTLRFADLFGALLRRISMLTYFHSETPLVTDFAGLVRAAEGIGFTETEFVWQDWTRYSGRQKTLLEMGGVIGSADLVGSDIAPFWPYLWLGQWVHVGKGTSMGLGRYRLESTASL
ncbi:MAG: CRISPR system precrRNA processing endoribonuclease RAMP protein Cas6 [Burkholderiales bacterium]